MSSIRSDRYSKIIENLVAARKVAGVTQTELGKKIGQRQTFISKVELLERRLDVAEFIEICEAMDVNWREIAECL